MIDAPGFDFERELDAAFLRTYHDAYGALFNKARQDGLKPEQVTPQWCQLVTSAFPDKFQPPLSAMDALARFVRGRLIALQSPALALSMGIAPPELDKLITPAKVWSATAKSDKREPEVLLADEFLTDIPKLQKIMSTHGAQRRQVDAALTRYKIALRKANRFQLDDDLTRLVTEVANNATGESMARRLGSAVVPYETTWIEFPLRVKVQVSKDAGLTIDQPHHDMADVPEKLGLLIERDFQTPTAFAVTMVSRMVHNQSSIIRTDEAHTLVSPVSPVYLFDLNRHPDRVAGYQRVNTRRDKGYEVPDELGEIADDYLAATAWGFTDRIDHERVGITTPKILHNHAAIAESPLHQAIKNVSPQLAPHRREKYIEVITQDFLAMAVDHTGMLRWTMTLLGMLAEVPVRHTAVAPTGSRMVGTLRKPYMDFHKLTVKVPKTRAVRYIERKLDKAAKSRHRAHEVRSHWRTYLNEMQERCEHNWEYDHEDGYRLCSKCMAYGRLIKEHIRGDASLGWVKKDYYLEANPAAPQVHREGSS